MKLQPNFFAGNGVLNTFAAAFLLVSIRAAVAGQCEPLTGTLGSPPQGLVTYQLPDLTGTDLLGRDGSRVRAYTYAPAPVLRRTGVQPPLPSQHWTNLVDLAVYNDSRAKDKYLFSARPGELRLCRIEHQNGDRGTIERFDYDDADRLTGWQMLYKEDGKWQVSGHRCFGYDADGRLIDYASASGPIDCRALKPGEIQAHYLRDNAGKLTRVISFSPARQLGMEPDIKVILFDDRGEATHFIEKDVAGDPLQFEIIAENIDILRMPDRFIKIKDQNFEIVLMNDVLVERNSPWRIILGGADASADDYLARSAKVRVAAEGQTDEEGRVSLSGERKLEIWNFVNAHPDRACLMSYVHCLLLHPVYPPEEWARCIDPRQRDPLACRVH